MNNYLPPPPPPPLPGTEVVETPFDSAGNNTSVCVAFILNCCQNGNNCRFAHKNDRSLVIFCKEFLKTAGCQKPLCRFTHATSAEQKAFKEKDILLPSLQSRITTLTPLPAAQPWTATKPPGTPSPFNNVSTTGDTTTFPSTYQNGFSNFGNGTSSNSQSPANILPINTSIPPPNMAPQFGFQSRVPFPPLNQPPPNIRGLWMQSLNGLPSPSLFGDSSPKPTREINQKCQKCCYNSNRLKQSNQEVEKLMEQHADLDLHYNKLQMLFKELKAGAVNLMKDYQNPQIRSLILNQLKTCDPADENIDLEIERASYQNQYQMPDATREAAMQQQLALLINDKKRKLSQFINVD